MAQGGYKEELENELKQTDPSSHASRLVAQEIDRLTKGDDNVAMDQKKDKPSVPHIELHSDRPQRIVAKFVIPIKEHPRYNFVGKLLGPKGTTLKALQEQTGCKMAIMGKGSMRDKNKEEELRKEGGKFSHLNEDLHVMVECFAEAIEGYHRIANAMVELKKFLIPEIGSEEMYGGDGMGMGGDMGMNGAGRGGGRGRGGRGSYRGGPPDRGMAAPPRAPEGYPPSGAPDGYSGGGHGAPMGHGGPSGRGGAPPGRGAPRGAPSSRGAPSRGGGHSQQSAASYDGYNSQGYGSGGYEHQGYDDGYSSSRGATESSYYDYGAASQGYDSYSGGYGDYSDSYAPKAAPSQRGGARGGGGAARPHPYGRPSHQGGY